MEDASWLERQKSVVAANRYMLDAQLACDVHFVVQGYGDRHAVSIGAHRYVLYSRSPVFFQLFCTGQRSNKSAAVGSDDENDDVDWEKQSDEEVDAADTIENIDGEIRIDDMPSEAFKQLLRYIYYEEVTLTDENFMYVLYAARKYRVSTLEEICQRYIDKAMTVERVLGVLRQSLTFADQQMRDRCLQFICRETSDVLKERQFADSDEDIVAMIVGQEQLTIAEVDLFNACVRWATNRLKRDDPDAAVDGPALRVAMEPLLQRIRFPTMSLDDFSNGVVPLGVLTSDETLELYKYLTCPVKPTTRFDTTRRAVNMSCLLTLGSTYKTKSVPHGRQALECHGNVNRRICLQELRFITQRIPSRAGSPVDVIQVYMVKLEQPGRVVELTLSTSDFKQREQTALQMEPAPYRKPDKQPVRMATATRIQKLAFPAMVRKSERRVVDDDDDEDDIGVTEYRCYGDYLAKPEPEVRRGALKLDSAKTSTLTADGERYQVLHVYWDDQQLLTLDEGDFTLTYAFNVARSERHHRLSGVDEFDAVVVSPVSALSSGQCDVLYVRRLDYKRFDFNHVCFTMNFASGPLQAFTFRPL